MDKCSIKPLQDFVAIEPVHQVEKDLSESTGLILPDKMDLEPTNKGKVLALGELVKLPIKVNDIVLFKPHLFDALDYGKSIIMIGREGGIYAKL